MSGESKEEKEFLPFIDDWFADYYKQKHLDPIYGEIEIADYQQKIIATPHFNRLRDLKQMGEAHYVFSNAQHTRFSHSVGVAHLTKQMYRHLTTHSQENRYNALEEMLLVTAAMCHDLGHGPNSHSFEVWADGKFNHEEMSLKLIWHAIEHGYFEFLSTETLLFDGLEHPPTDANFATKKQWIVARNFAIICSMIQETEENELLKLVPKGKVWLFDIVHNTTLDSDRMDYLVRDMHSVYGSTSPNVRMTQIIDSTRIINGRVRFNVLACNQLYEALYLRASMHKNVYTHDGVIAVKYMFHDLLHMIDAATEHAISDSMLSPDAFLLLSDCVFQPWNALRNRSSAAASVLMRRIATQDHYVVVARKIVFSKPVHVTVERLLERYRGNVDAVATAALGDSGDVFSDKTLFIVSTRFDLGNGTQDPLQGKIFYRSTQYRGEEECYKTSDSCSCFYDNSRHKVEYLLRLYSKLPPDTVPMTQWQRLCTAFHDVVHDNSSTEL